MAKQKDDMAFEPPKFPYHAIVVHVPVSVWTFAFIFDLLGYFNVGGNVMVRLSFFAIALGLAVALIAIPMGVLDWGGVKREKPAWKLGLYHMALNLMVTVLFAINLGVRFVDWRFAEKVGGFSLLLSGVGTVMLLISAYIGGKMIYTYGVSVARRSKEKWKKIAAEGGARIAEE